MSTKRIQGLKKKLRADNLDALVLTHLPQVRYLSGFSGSAALLVLTRTSADFFTDSRYTIQASKEVKGARVTIIGGAALPSLADVPKLQKKNLRVGFTADHLSVTARNSLQSAMPNALLIPADGVLAELDWVKDKTDLASITSAVTISDIAFERILNLVAPGIRERELAAELEYQMMMLGSEKPAFESIVASGYRSAMPHGVASSKKLKKGDFVTFDFGAVVDGYCSDITRTVVVGKASNRQKKVYGTVLRAQMAGIRKVRAGVTGKAVDAACRNLITRAGYGKYFGHGTGHGISLEVHSGPRVSPLSPDKLKPGNVITIEPGIYITGWGGVRIEDDVVVTRSGSRVLNRAEKKLLEL